VSAVANAGFPAAERAMRGSTNIEILSDEDQELLRVACKAVSLFFTFYIRTQLHIQ